MHYDISKTFLITDLDGTLLPESKILTENNLKAIEKFRKAGGKFSIATGRIIQTAKVYFEQLKIDVPIILCNGGMIYDPTEKQILKTHTINNKVRQYVKEIMGMFPQTGVEIDIDNKVYVVRMNEHERHHISFTGISYEEKDIDDLPDGWGKVLFSLDNSEMSKLTSFIESKNYSDICFVTSGPHFCEILPSNCSKGTALKEIIETLGYNDYTVFAVGDYDNDIEMIQYANVGYAPANALNKVKEIADIVTIANCEDGVIAEIIDDIFKKKLEVE